MKRFWIRRGLRFLAFSLLFVGLAGLSVMTLWNALLPDLVNVPAITFGQALGLLLLSRLLFGGFRGYGSGRTRWGRGYDRGRTNPGRTEWKQKMAERWQQMTPEQREQLKQRWNQCGGRGRRGASQPDQPGQDQPTTTAI